MAVKKRNLFFKLFLHKNLILNTHCQILQVLSEGPHGPPVYYATVGQMVKQFKKICFGKSYFKLSFSIYHKWTCEANGPNQFCMTVVKIIKQIIHLIIQKWVALTAFMLCRWWKWRQSAINRRKRVGESGGGD